LATTCRQLRATLARCQTQLSILQGEHRGQQQSEASSRLERRLREDCDKVNAELASAIQERLKYKQKSRDKLAADKKRKNRKSNATGRSSDFKQKSRDELAAGSKTKKRRSNAANSSSKRSTFIHRSANAHEARRLADFRRQDRQIAAAFRIQRWWKERQYKIRYPWQMQHVGDPHQDSRLKSVLEMAKEVGHLFSADGGLEIDSKKLALVCDLAVEGMSRKQLPGPGPLLHTVSVFTGTPFRRIGHAHGTQGFATTGEGIANWHQSVSLSSSKASGRCFCRQQASAMLLAVFIYVSSGQSLSKCQLLMLRDLLFGDHASMWLHTSYYRAVQWCELEPQFQ
jgi:hypothetical protein